MDLLFGQTDVAARLAVLGEDEAGSSQRIVWMSIAEFERA